VNALTAGVGMIACTGSPAATPVHTCSGSVGKIGSG
jgi:hypothetical protein